MFMDFGEETEELEKTVWFVQYSPYTEAVSLTQLVEETKKDATLQQLKKALRRGYLSKCRETGTLCQSMGPAGHTRLGTDHDG